ncbi:MAG: hypothetical protein HLX50_08930 [Alteromonadaceae bacterium]|nr:hypothetical protein [Alteromonadaceae bacterium]
MQKIPNIFWYTLSFCMFAATVAIIGFASQASSISLGYDKYKLELKSAVIDTKAAQQQLEIKRRRLAEAESLINAQLDNLKRISDQLAATECAPNLPSAEDRNKLQSTIADFLIDDDIQLESLQEAMKTLEKLDPSSAP